MRSRPIVLLALVPLVILIVVLAVLVILAVLPRSVIGDIAYPPPTPLPAQPACPVASESDPLCVVVLGDSLAAGVPLAGDDRWWMRLEQALTEALPGRQVAVVNWAVPRGRVNVLESAANDQPDLESFDIAIVIEGVNDVDHTPTDEWAKRYEAAVDRLEERGLTVVVSAPAPSFHDSAFETRFNAVDGAVRAMAAPDRPLLDIAAAFRAAGSEVAAGYYSDGLHQSDAGQQVIARMATQAVMGLIEAR